MIYYVLCQKKKKKKWPEFLPEVVYAYNATPHSSTGFAPFYLLFGQNPRLPVDVLLGADEEGEELSLDDWIVQHHHKIAESFERAEAANDRGRQKNKKRLDRKLHDIPFKEGDRVYLRSRKARGRQKIQDKWDSRVYRVLRRFSSTSPLYEVVPDGASVDVTPKVVNRKEMRLCTTFQRPEDQPAKMVEEEKDMVEDFSDVTDSDTELVTITVGANPLEIPYLAPGLEEEVNSQLETPEGSLPELDMTEPISEDYASEGSSHTTTSQDVPEAAEEETVAEEAVLDAAEEEQDVEMLPADLPQEEIEAEVATPEPEKSPEPTLRRSGRPGKGQHSNPHHLPRSTLK
jgi:hypothetical protein